MAAWYFFSNLRLNEEWHFQQKETRRNSSSRGRLKRTSSCRMEIRLKISHKLNDLSFYQFSTVIMRNFIFTSPFTVINDLGVISQLVRRISTIDCSRWTLFHAPTSNATWTKGRTQSFVPSVTQIRHLSNNQIATALRPFFFSVHPGRKHWNMRIII